jgi:SET domain
VVAVCQQQVVLVNALAATKSKGRKGSSQSTSTSGGGGFGAASKAPTFIHTTDTGESTQRLLQFLKAQKAKGLDNVDIGFHQDTGVRGLFCTTNLKKGQIVCQIPSDCALALSDPNKNGDDAPSIAHGGANFLDMYWNHGQNKQLWSPYLETLPKRGSEQFDPTPDFLVEDDLALLEFPRLIQRAKERKAQVAAVAVEKGISEEELQFATWLVSSRAFQLSLSAPAEEKDEMPQYDDRGQVIDKAQKKTIRVMVPFIDMANHSSDQPNCKLTLIDPEKDDAWFALEATRPITAGKELVISYGSGVDSSVELLMDYGFVPSSNRIDSIMLVKGGDDVITTLEGWTTTLEEDRTMLEMAKDDPVLQKILRFRIRLKESYK